MHIVKATSALNVFSQSLAREKFTTVHLKSGMNSSSGF